MDGGAAEVTLQLSYPHVVNAAEMVDEAQAEFEHHPVTTRLNFSDG
jgi:hypothetical protein